MVGGGLNEEGPKLLYGLDSDHRSVILTVTTEGERLFQLGKIRGETNFSLHHSMPGIYNIVHDKIYRSNLTNLYVLFTLRKPP